MRQDLKGAGYLGAGKRRRGRVIACDPAKAVKPDTSRNGESGEKARTWHGIGMGHEEGPVVVSSGDWYGGHRISAEERGKGHAIWVNRKRTKMWNGNLQNVWKKRMVYKAWSAPKYVRK